MEDRIGNDKSPVHARISDCSSKYPHIFQLPVVKKKWHRHSTIFERTDSDFRNKSKADTKKYRHKGGREKEFQTKEVSNFWQKEKR